MSVLLMGVLCGIGIGIATARFAFDSMLKREDKKLKDERDHLRGEVKRLRAQVALHIGTTEVILPVAYPAGPHTAAAAHVVP